MRRPAAATLGTLFALGLSACLTACADASDPPRDSPREGTAADPETVAEYADDVLLSLHTTGGEGAPGAPVPDHEVRTDGTVFLSTNDGLGVDTFTLTDAGLEQVRAAFEVVSLAQDDYDESDWTDQPVTTLYSTLGGRPEQIRVYGFGFDDDVRDDDWERLDGAVDVLADLATAATHGTSEEIATERASYRPEQVALVLRRTEDSPDETWPFTAQLPDDPSDPTCVLLGPTDVALLEAAVEEYGDEPVWSTSTGAVAAEVRPVLRGTPPACTGG